MTAGARLNTEAARHGTAVTTGAASGGQPIPHDSVSHDQREAFWRALWDASDLVLELPHDHQPLGTGTAARQAGSRCCSRRFGCFCGVIPGKPGCRSWHGATVATAAKSCCAPTRSSAGRRSQTWSTPSHMPARRHERTAGYHGYRGARRRSAR